MTTAAPNAPRSPWMINPGLDSLLIIATPLLILPLFMAAKASLTTAMLTSFATMLALGHHLPGMMRAYGDRALFQRFKWRFILAPIFLVGVSVFFATKGLNTVVMLAFFWGAYHWMMQSYGFMRIYDGKAGIPHDPMTARLDKAMCFVWFGVAFFLAPRPLYRIVMEFYKSGAPAVPGGLLLGFRFAWLALTALVTIAFFANLVKQARAGVRPNLIKLVLMAITFLYYGYALAAVDNPLVAYALFEMFHDVQYLTIVWLFNRRRAGQEDAGGFTKFLFRQRGLFILLYVGLCLGYGSMDFVARGLEDPQVHRIALALIVASSMLHFYYDGFIWKLREASTASVLGAGGENSGKATKARPALKHLATWCIFLVPMVAFGLMEWNGRDKKKSLDPYRAAAVSLPDNVWAQAGLCGMLLQFEDLDSARTRCAEAAKLAPDEPGVLANLGNLKLAEEEPAAAQALFERALATDREFAPAQLGMGAALAGQGKIDAAIPYFERAQKLEKRSVPARFNLGLAFEESDRWAEAIAQYESALRLGPGNAEAHFRRARCLRKLKREAEAIAAYQAAVQLAPDHLAAFYEAGLASLATRQLDQAGWFFTQADQLAPNEPDILHHLGATRGMQGNVAEAERLLRQVLKVDPSYEPSRRALQDLIRRRSR